MSFQLPIFSRVRLSGSRTKSVVQNGTVFAALLLLPLAVHAQGGGSPFDTGFTALQTLFTGTIAKVASLIAIVIGGYGFAHGEPGAKKSEGSAAEDWRSRLAEYECR